MDRGLTRAWFAGLRARVAARWRPRRAQFPLRPAGALLVLGAALLVTAAAPADVELVRHTTAIEYQKVHREDDLDAWHSRVPKTEVVTIPSSADGKKQLAIWYDSKSQKKKPLLIALHSWSADFEQNLDIPFAEFAIANDWAFLHPDFRGPNLRPEATASELAIQDVLDAVTWARRKASIDADRIYLVGYSGGAMKALVLAGKEPGLWAGVAAWCAIYDIADWFRHNRGRNPRYRREISASCGGAPNPGTPAEAECRDRSPMTHLEAAAGKVPVLIAHGVQDDTVPLSHAIGAYDLLAAREDRFAPRDRQFIAAHGKLPDRLRARTPLAQPDYDRARVPLVLERRSRAVTLHLFDGGHDMVYNVALRWLSEQRRR